MYLLKWTAGDRTQYVGIFSTLENGRAFMKKIPGYRHEVFEDDGDRFEEERITYESLPDLLMVEYEGYRVPLSRFSFETDIIVIWIELDQLDAQIPSGSENAERTDRKIPEPGSKKGFSYVPSSIPTPSSAISAGTTVIDAYSIDNEDVEDYVLRREEQFQKCKEILENHGFEVSRGCFGSEDGEAIFYRKKTAEIREDADKGEREHIEKRDGGWHFLTHLDPLFLDADLEKEITEWITFC